MNNDNSLAECLFHTLGHLTALAIMMPMITPKRPRAPEKIWVMSILTYVDGVCACARAVLDPMTPTEMPQHKLLNPTTKPTPKQQ